MTDDFDASLRAAVAGREHDVRRIFGDLGDHGETPPAGTAPAGPPRVHAGAGTSEGHPTEVDDFDSNLRRAFGNP